MRTTSRPRIVRMEQLGKATRSAVQLALAERPVSFVTGPTAAISIQDPTVMGYMNPDPIDPFAPPSPLAE